jgi:hypothetical protein
VVNELQKFYAQLRRARNLQNFSVTMIAASRRYSRVLLRN